MAKAEYRKEAAFYGLKSARSPMENSLLSGVVLVSDEGGKGYAYITFGEALVEAVGRVMPRGISEDDQCYLKAMLVHGGSWRVYSYYLDNSSVRFLWEEKKRPKWIKQIRRAQ